MSTGIFLISPFFVKAVWEESDGICRRLCKITRENWGIGGGPGECLGHEKPGRHACACRVGKRDQALRVRARITNRVPSISTRLTIQVMYTFWTKPATTKPTTQTQATVST